MQNFFSYINIWLMKIFFACYVTLQNSLHTQQPQKWIGFGFQGNCKCFGEKNQ